MMGGVEEENPTTDDLAWVRAKSMILVRLMDWWIDGLADGVAWYSRRYETDPWLLGSVSAEELIDEAFEELRAGYEERGEMPCRAAFTRACRSELIGRAVRSMWRDPFRYWRGR